MYWQVYLHKTSLVAELILIKIFKRFRSLVLEKNEIITSSHILYHLIHANSDVYMTDSVLTQYLSLEDSDILHLLKNWINHKDNVLSTLSKQIIYRDLPKIKIQIKSPMTLQEVEMTLQTISLTLQNRIYTLQNEKFAEI